MEDAPVGDILHLERELFASMQMALGVCWGEWGGSFLADHPFRIPSLVGAISK